MADNEKPLRGNPRIAPTAHYTAQAWVKDGFPNAELFDTLTGRTLYRIVRATTTLWGPLLPDHIRYHEQYLFIRHHVYEERLRQVNPDFVLEVGAGLSPRGLTFARERPGMTYVEADLPHMVAEKRRRLGNTSLPPNYHLTTIDLLGNGLGLSIKPKQGQKLLAITEGVTDYLTMEEKKAAWRNLSSFLREGGGGTYLCEIHPFSQFVSYRGLSKIYMTTIGTLVGGLSFNGRIFERPEDATALLCNSGFDDAKVLDTARLNTSRHHPAMDKCPWLLVEAVARP
ncbi:MAG: hypothetical protein AB1405_08210 [Bdellovibrionota bacterium]